MTLYSYSIPYLVVVAYPVVVLAHVLAVATHAVRARRA